MISLTEPIIHFILETEFKKLPPSTIHATKRCILDCLGVAIAGSRSLGVREVVDLAVEMGGIKESRIWTYGMKAPAQQATFVNSVMAHALDYDDSYRPGIIHPTCSTLPTTLAMCEKIGGQSGKDLILSVCLGNDIACRLAAALKPYDPYDHKLPPWRNSAICSAFGCVVAVSKLRNDSFKTVRDALGIVYSQIAGNKQCEIDGATVKRMQPGFMAQAALSAAFLAQKRVSGAKDIFEGTYGFFEVYGNRNANPAEVLEGLGKTFRVEEIGFKVYPCCALIQAPIEATLELKRTHRLKPDEVEIIKVIASPMVVSEVGREYVPGENPRVDAQFSIPYNLATAMIRGDVNIGDFELEAVTNPERVRFSKRIEIIDFPGMKGGLPITVEIHTTKGERFSKTLEERKGDIKRALSDEELSEKFYKCVGYSDFSDKKKKAKLISEMILNIEEREELESLLDLL
jgi:2-methylcitrate dehydratase PrpD